MPFVRGSGPCPLAAMATSSQLESQAELQDPRHVATGRRLLIEQLHSERYTRVQGYHDRLQAAGSTYESTNAYFTEASQAANHYLKQMTNVPEPQVYLGSGQTACECHSQHPTQRCIGLKIRDWLRDAMESVERARTEVQRDELRLVQSRPFSCVVLLVLAERCRGPPLEVGLIIVFAILAGSAVGLYGATHIGIRLLVFCLCLAIGALLTILRLSFHLEEQHADERKLMDYFRLLVYCWRRPIETVAILLASSCVAVFFDPPRTSLCRGGKGGARADTEGPGK